MLEEDREGILVLAAGDMDCIAMGKDVMVERKVQKTCERIEFLRRNGLGEWKMKGFADEEAEQHTLFNGTQEGKEGGKQKQTHASVSVLIR